MVTEAKVENVIPVRSRHDRWADWAVIGVLVVALLLGWLVMTLALGQRETFADADLGLTVRYPKDWLLKPNDQLAFQAVDPASGSYKTTYQVRVWPIEATTPTTATLAAVLNDASLARAQGVTAFRTFDIVEGKSLGGQPSMESSYVFVAEGNDLFQQRLPVVVEGLDVAVARDGKAFVFSLLAAEDAFQASLPAFRRFVESAVIQ